MMTNKQIGPVTLRLDITKIAVRTAFENGVGVGLVIGSVGMTLLMVIMGNG